MAADLLSRSPVFTRFKAIWPGDYSTFTQAAPFLPRLLLPCPVLVCLLKPHLLMGKKWSHYVVPQGPRRPPMMTFREATAEGQSDDTQVKGAQLRAGSYYKQDSQQWHCMRTPPPGAQSPPEGLPRARGQGTACWETLRDPGGRFRGQVTAHGLTGSRGHRRDQPPWGGCFRTAFTIQGLTGKQSSCSSKDTNLKITQ